MVSKNISRSHCRVFRRDLGLDDRDSDRAIVSGQVKVPQSSKTTSRHDLHSTARAVKNFK